MIDVNLFAGGGGLARGLVLAGFRQVHLYELNPAACKTLTRNSVEQGGSLPGVVHEGDIRTVSWRMLENRVRLLAAGVPCQPFSRGGVRRGHQDPRNLFPELFRAIEVTKPVAVLLENVFGMTESRLNHYFKYMLLRLRYPSVTTPRRGGWITHGARLMAHQRAHNNQPEYHVQWRILNAADYGVPQIRRRLVIVCVRAGLPEFSFPAETHSSAALRRDQMSGSYWVRHGLKPPRGTYETQIAFDDGKMPWLTVRDAIRDLPAPEATQEKAWNNHWVIPGARTYRGHAGSLLDWPSKTIKAGVHGVPGGENMLVENDGNVRYYTLREAALIQSFPNDHIFEGHRSAITRQIGNAVPPALAAAVARKLRINLEQYGPDGISAAEHGGTRPIARAALAG